MTRITTIVQPLLKAPTSAFFSFAAQELQRKKRAPNPLIMYVHRYLRLTPLMAFWLLMYYKLTPQMGDGPFWPAYVHQVNP